MTCDKCNGSHPNAYDDGDLNHMYFPNNSSAYGITIGDTQSSNSSNFVFSNIAFATPDCYCGCHDEGSVWVISLFGHPRKMFKSHRKAQEWRDKLDISIRNDCSIEQWKLED